MNEINMLIIFDIVCVIITIGIVGWAIEKASEDQAFGKIGCAPIIFGIIFLAILWKLNGCIHGCAGG